MFISQIIDKKFSYVKTFVYLCTMERKILYYKQYFIDFFMSLDEGAKKKVAYVLDMLKTQKTPQNEIEKAIKLKEEYYAGK